MKLYANGAGIPGLSGDTVEPVDLSTGTRAAMYRGTLRDRSSTGVEGRVVDKPVGDHAKNIPSSQANAIETFEANKPTSKAEG